MPAAAVIPAPIAYIKAAAVKKLVVGSRGGPRRRRPGRESDGGLVPSTAPPRGLGRRGLAPQSPAHSRVALRWAVRAAGTSL